MIKTGAKFLGAAALFLSVHSSLGFAENALSDLLPWPWGSECPFPWTQIEGDWVARKDHSERFTFIVKGTWENGTKVLEVRRFDSQERLIGIGEGVAPKGERIVRAAMTGVGPDEGHTYWALVRTYVERINRRNRSCAKNKQVTVITLRPAEGNSPDVHVIVDREDSNPREKRP